MFIQIPSGRLKVILVFFLFNLFSVAGFSNTIGPLGKRYNSAAEFALAPNQYTDYLFFSLI